MSENLELVRSIYADWERGDFSSSDWAHPAIEYGDVEGPLEGATGQLGDIGRGVRDFLAEWQDFRLVADRLQELDSEHVLALDHRVGRSRTSGLEAQRRPNGRCAPLPHPGRPSPQDRRVFQP